MEVQYLSHQEAVHREAQRIASLSAWKLLRSRSQRGGMRLHRSLQLALVMRSARELLISSAPEPKAAPPPAAAAAAAARESRKRRSCGSQVAELVPYKRACLWQETPQPQLQEGAFPGLAQVLQKLLMSSQVVGRCRALGTGHIPGVNTRAVEAF